MTLNEYQDFTDSVNLYPEDTQHLTLALGLVGEAGEIANKTKKIERDRQPICLEDMKAELGDVLWYVSALSDYYGITLQDVLDYNVSKLKARQAQGTLQGSGDNR